MTFHFTAPIEEIGLPTRSIRDVLEAVAKHYGLTPNELTGDSRRPCVTMARWASYYLASRDLGRGSEVIARTFNKDGGSVRKAIRTLTASLPANTALMAEIQQVRGILRGETRNARPFRYLTAEERAIMSPLSERLIGWLVAIPLEPILKPKDTPRSPDPMSDSTETPSPVLEAR